MYRGRYHASYNSDVQILVLFISPIGWLFVLAPLVSVFGTFGWIVYFSLATMQLINALGLHY